MSSYDAAHKYLTLPNRQLCLLRARHIIVGLMFNIARTRIEMSAAHQRPK